MPMCKTSETQSLRKTITYQTFHNGPTIFIRSSFAALLFLCFFPFLPDLGDLLFWLFEPLLPFPYVFDRYLDGLDVGPWDGFFVGFAVNFTFNKVGGDVKDLVGLSVELTGVLGLESGDKATVGLSVFFNVGGCVLCRLGICEEAMVGVCVPIDVGSGEDTMVGFCDSVELGSREAAMMGACVPGRLGAGVEIPEGLDDALTEGLFVGDTVGKADGLADGNVQVLSREGIDSTSYTIHPIESPAS